MIEDCSGSIRNSFKRLEKHYQSSARLYYDIHITNTDGVEFSTEENGTRSILAILFVIYAIGLAHTFSKISQEYRNHDEWDKALIFLFIAMIAETLQLLCQSLHFWKYGVDGIGIPFLYILGDAMEVIASFTIIIILIMLASGWTIEFESILKFDLLIPLSTS